MRDALIIVNMSASFAWVISNSDIVFPNALLSLLYFTAFSKAAWAIPVVRAPIVTRPPQSIFLAYSKPSPSVPTRFSFGTFAFSNTTSEVTDPLTPSFSMSLLDFAFFESTRNADGPLAVLAKRKYKSQYPPFVVNIFVPLTIHSLPSNRAWVCMFRASDPAPGSVRDNAAKDFPLIIPGRNCFFCSGLLNCRTPSQQVP